MLRKSIFVSLLTVKLVVAGFMAHWFVEAQSSEPELRADCGTCWPDIECGLGDPCMDCD